MSRAGWLSWHAAAVFAFLYLPIVTLIVYSFNGAGVGGFPPRDLTFDWYRQLFSDDAIWSSVFNSFLVAIAAVTIALALGIPAALALDRGALRDVGGEVVRVCARGVALDDD